MKLQNSSQQLEIFPLHPGTNPARPAGGRNCQDFPSRASCRRLSAGLRNHHQLTESGRFEPTESQRLGQDRPTQHVARWRVAQQAWKAVEKFRATRDGVAMSFQQGMAAVICQPGTEENPEQLSPLEQVLAVAGFLVVVALVVSAI